MHTNLIPTQNVSSLTAAIEKLAKKAAKLGCVAPTVTFGNKVMIKVGDEQYIEKIEVTVTGNAPKLNGWSFIGTIEAVEGNSVLRSVPGDEIPEHYRNANPCNCDHCNINRKRNSTFIVRNESGAFKQIGRSCLKDFLGHASPEQVAAYAESLAELNIGDYEDSSGYGSHQYAFNTVNVIAAAICSIKLFGYKKTDCESSTKDSVAYHLTTKIAENRLPIEASHIELTKDAVVWMQQQTGSEFLLNVAAYAKCEAISFKAFGYISAAAMMFLKSLEEKIVAKIEVNDCGIANQGEKINVRATVIAANSFQRDAYHYYDSGVSQVLVMKTESGHLIKMFTSNMSINVDDVVIVSGKIKDCVKENFQKSTFFGRMMTQMAPRSRITLVDKS